MDGFIINFNSFFSGLGLIGASRALLSSVNPGELAIACAGLINFCFIHDSLDGPGFTGSRGLFGDFLGC